MTFERRYFELRQDGGRRLVGTAIVYGETAKIGGVFPERFEAGAFAPLGDVMLNEMHQRAAPLARTGGGGLELVDSREALRFVADLPETRGADDVLALVRAGVYRGASIEFKPLSQRMDSGVRVVTRARLGGVSIVDRPAYAQSEIEARMAAHPAPRRRVWL